MTTKWALSAALMMFTILMLTQTNPTAGMTALPIQHVIIIMQENHSFDNYFGTYPTANGTLLDTTASQLSHVNGLPRNVCLPYAESCVSPYLSTSHVQPDPVEGQLVYQMDYGNEGTGFGTYSGPQSMAYFDYHIVAGYWDYAEEYGLGDNYFAPVLSTTTPNRLMLLAGDTPVSSNYGPPPYISYSGTVMHQLDDAGVSWGYYDFLNTYNGASNVYPLNYTQPPQQALTDIRNISELNQELVSGLGLPAVSFVNSLGAPYLTEHPPFNPTTGELWAISIINRVMKSSYWPYTAIFLTWDEGGGFYDHVIPPRGFTLNHSFTNDLQGLGQRVPLLVISPYSKENYVSTTLLSHLSLLHFVEFNWHLPPLNQRVAESNLPLDFFDYSQTPRTPLVLDSPISYPVPQQPQPSASLAHPTIQDNPVYMAILLPVTIVAAFALRRFSARREKQETLQPQ